MDNITIMGPIQVAEDSKTYLELAMVLYPQN